MTEASDGVLIRTRGLTKRYPGVVALDSVDFELRGCPVSKHQLIELITATLAGRVPRVPKVSQCVECKLSGTVCVMVAQGTPCLGPVTQAGCGNLCPSVGRGCYGCFGPKETPNTASLATWMTSTLNAEPRAVRDLFRDISGGAEAFRKESESHD